MRRLSGDKGWTLIELLVAMTLMLIVLSATLTSFNAFSNNSKRSADFNDQQDKIRVTLNQIVRQARNLANPTTGSTTGSGTTIAYASADRLVFQTTDPSKQWVSYCLNVPSTDPSHETIQYQTTGNNALDPATVAANMTTGCPAGGGWQTTTLVGDFITNQKDSAVNRPLFAYYSRTGQLPDPNQSPPFASDPSRVASADTSKIVRVAMSVFLKLDPNRPPAETQLASAAFMRNQNQAPTASFVADVSGTNYTFDAGASGDPEGRTLLYDWYLAPPTVTAATMPSTSALPSCRAKTPNFTNVTNATTWSCLGTTVVLSNKAISGSKYVFLRVTDPGNLQAMTPLSTGGNCVSVTSGGRVATNCGAVP
jgi:prepilin-type N-terminal cleavage/methylation domain-containing protein